jgi:hypothetical protein
MPSCGPDSCVPDSAILDAEHCCVAARAFIFGPDLHRDPPFLNAHDVIYRALHDSRLRQRCFLFFDNDPAVAAAHR